MRGVQLLSDRRLFADDCSDLGLLKLDINQARRQRVQRLLPIGPKKSSTFAVICPAIWATIAAIASSVKPKFAGFTSARCLPGKAIALAG